MYFFNFTNILSVLEMHREEEIGSLLGDWKYDCKGEYSREEEEIKAITYAGQQIIRSSISLERKLPLPDIKGDEVMAVQGKDA